jgi:hypothetical protein
LLYETIIVHLLFFCQNFSAKLAFVVLPFEGLLIHPTSNIQLVSCFPFSFVPIKHRNMLCCCPIYVGEVDNYILVNNLKLFYLKRKTCSLRYLITQIKLNWKDPWMGTRRHTKPNLLFFYACFYLCQKEFLTYLKPYSYQNGIVWSLLRWVTWFMVK